MSRKNNTLRKKRLKAAEAFVESWMTSELAYTLITDYSCTLGCKEAETYAGLFRAFKYPNAAESILADHGEACETPHHHEGRGVWTFNLLIGGPYVPPDTSYTIVADGADGAEAEQRATEFLRGKLKEKGMPFTYIDVEEVESGVPGSTALYSWIDIREAA